MLKITYHASERFLQRAFGLDEITKQDLRKAHRLLETDTKDIVLIGHKKHIPLPSFKGYLAVIVNNTIVTILPKSQRRKFKKHYGRKKLSIEAA